MPSLASVLKLRGEWWAEREGIDCAGAGNTHVAIQAAIDGMTDGDRLVFPRGALCKIGAQVNMSARVGLELLSHQRPLNQGAGPEFQWTGADGGTMFALEDNDGPSIQGFKFTCGSGKSLDTYIDIDGDGGLGHTPTLARVQYNTFNCPDAINPDYVALWISRLSNSNNENYNLSYNDFRGYSTRALHSYTGITNGTTALTLSSAIGIHTFVGKEGQRIRISYAGGMHDTTIAAVGSATACTLTDACAFTQTDCTVHVGEGYGIGIKIGDTSTGSNAFHTIIHNCNIQNHAIGIDARKGTADIFGYQGGFNDLGIYTKGGDRIVQYMAEGDMRAIQIASGRNAIGIDKVRLTNNSARADGWIYADAIANVVLTNCHPESSIQVNAVYLGSNGQGVLFSCNNFWGNDTPESAVGYSSFGKVVAMLDHVESDEHLCRMLGLPTSSAGLTTGDLYFNSGVLTKV